MTDFQSDYTDLSKVRGTAKADALVSQLKQQVALEDAAQLQAQQHQQPQPTAPQATQRPAPGKAPQANPGQASAPPSNPKQPTEPFSVWDVIKDAPGDTLDLYKELGQDTTKVMAGGVTDAAAGVWNLGNDAVKYLSDKLFDHKMQGQELQSVIPQPDSTAGKIARGVTQFTVPYTGALKLVGALPVLSKAPAVVKAMTAGAVVDYAAFTPEEKNAVNALQDVFGSSPVLHNAYVDFLRAEPGDSHATARAKQALIGLHLGAAADTLMAGMKAAKNFLGPRAADVWSSITKAQAMDKAQASAIPKGGTAQQAAPIVTPQSPSLQENVKALIERRTGQPLSGTKASTAKRRVDTELTYTDPLNQKKLDQWEAAAKEAQQAAQQVAAKGRPLWDALSVFGKGTQEGAPPVQAFQKFHLDGEAPLIGHVDDPMVKELDHDIGDALGVTTPEGKALDAQAVPGFARTAEQRLALQAYAKLQDAALDSFKRNFQQLPSGAGRVFSDEARQFLKGLSKGEASGVAREGDVLVSHVQARQQLIEQGASLASRLPNATLSASLHGAEHSGSVSAPKLVEIIHGLDKGQVASGAAAAALTAAGAAGATSEDAQGDTSQHSASDVVLGALAAFAAYKLHGGVKAFMVRKGLQAVHPVASDLAHPGLEGLTVPSGLPAGNIPQERIKAMTDAAVSGSYRDLAGKVSTSDFNFNRFNTGEDVRNMVDAFTQQFTQEFTQAKRGAVSLAQTKEHAQALGVSMDSFKAMHANTANLDATVTAHRAVFAAHAQHVVEVAQVAASMGTDASILAARQAVARHATIQAHMKASQTEIARALSAMRIVSNDASMATKELHTMVEGLGGRDANMEFMRRLSQLEGDVLSLTKVAQKGALARTRDALYESFVSGILSGPSTQVANVVGNTAAALWSGVERQVAVGFSKAAGRDIGEGVTQAEVNSYISGMVHGFGASLRVSSVGRAGIAEAAGLFLKGQQDAAMGVIQKNAQEMGGFWTALLTGEGKATTTAMGPEFLGASPQRVPAISSQGLHLDSDSYLGQAVDYLGAAVRTPLRALGAADDVFKSAYFQGELHAQGTRDGLSKGLKGDALYEHVAQFVENPTRDARAAATEAADKGTFSNPLGDKLKWATAMQRNVPLARWVLPFVKTPLNVVTYVGERTPMLRSYSDAVKADLQAGGARADLANARLAAASLLYLTGFSLTSAGLFTGGGDGKQQAESLSGPGQYSLKVGDQWIALNRLAPLGMFLGLAADMSELQDHWSEHEAPALVGAAVLALSRNISSQTMAAGISDLVDALNQAQRGNTDRLSLWGNNLTASALTPFSSMLRTMARDDDPYAKEVWDLADAFKARLPGYSKDVFNKVDALGNDVKARSGVFPVTQDSEDPAARELRRLNVDLKRLPKALRVADGMPAIDLTPKQYYHLQKIHGGLFKEALAGAISQEQWATVPESRGDMSEYKSQKDLIVKTLHQETRKAATSKLLQEFPELQQKMRMVMTGRPH